MQTIEITLCDIQAKLYDDESMILVYFWDPDSRLCQDMNNVIEAALLMLTEQIRLAKVNVRAEPLVAKLFGIDAIPSYVILQSRDVVDAFKGLTSIEALAADIQALLDENTGGDLRSSSRPES